MGSIRRFDLKTLAKQYKADYFFETGTFWGDGVQYALDASFIKLISVEVMPEIAEKARLRFQGVTNVEIVEADSVKGLASKIGDLKGNCIFWLDAHFPGADAGLKPYDENMNDDFRLPLAREIETIARLRKKYNDVLIIDDLRIYEDGPFENGNVPQDALPASDRNIKFIYKHFRWSHVVVKSYQDEGYILLYPRWKYYALKVKKMMGK